METLEVQRISKSCSGSYRTYEEWKHRFFCCSTSDNISSYRTYEEWKRHEQKEPGGVL